MWPCAITPREWPNTRSRDKSQSLVIGRWSLVAVGQPLATGTASTHKWVWEGHGFTACGKMTQTSKFGVFDERRFNNLRIVFWSKNSRNYYVGSFFRKLFSDVDLPPSRSRASADSPARNPRENPLKSGGWQLFRSVCFRRSRKVLRRRVLGRESARDAATPRNRIQRHGCQPISLRRKPWAKRSCCVSFSLPVCQHWRGARKTK